MVVLIASLPVGCLRTSPLYSAAERGDLDTVNELLDKGADPNKKSGGGVLDDSNALDAASAEGHIQVVRLLLDKGANVNAAHGTMGWTPLSSAAWRGQTDVASLLVERGADINKAIVGLEKGVGTKNAIEMLREIKRERTSSAPRPLTGKPAHEPAPIVRSDVDELPVAQAVRSKNSYAIVIGIERYRQNLPAAEFASRDAGTVAEYIRKVLGYPSENVIVLIDDRALQSDLAKYFEKWLPNNVEPGSTVFVYFSGHGAPNPKTGDAYLVPYDGDPTFIEETGYSLKRMYAALGKLPAKEVIVALDSCFSGAGGRSVLAKGARPIVLSVENQIITNKNMTVLSASAGDQISSTYDEKGHGLFTYFMLKGIKNEGFVRKDGSLDIAGLYDYLKPQVSSIARTKYNNEQTPQLIGAKKQ